MGKRHLAKIALACLGIIMVVGLQGSPRITQALVPIDSARNPVNAVQAFFKAVERGDWLRARSLTSRDFWNRLEEQGQIKAWQSWLKQDGSLEFAGFTVLTSKVEQQTAVVDGHAVWVSAQGNVPRNSQTITLHRGIGGWCITSIETKESSGVVESFYLYLSQGKWEEARALVRPETWRDWQNRGVVAKIKAGYGKKTPYISASVDSATEQGGHAVVQADLVWMLPQEVHSKAVVTLVKTGNSWIIQQVQGGWPR